jgi:hypothetical protein
MRRTLQALALIFAAPLLLSCGDDDKYCYEIDSFTGQACETEDDCSSCGAFCQENDGRSTDEPPYCQATQCMCPCAFCYEGYTPP